MTSPLRHTASLALAVLLALPVLPSCSVKEDRSLVPGHVVLDMTEFKDLAPEFEFVLRRSGKDERVLTVTAEQAAVPFDIEEVYKHSYRWYVYPKREGISRADSTLWYDDALGAGRVHTAAGTADATGEYTLIRPEPRRQSATVVVKVPDYRLLPEGARIVISTLACGLEMDRCAVQDDTYEYEAVAEPEGVFRFEMLRQSGYYAALKIYEGESLLTALDLGVAMRDMGYDWTAPDLEDVLVVLNFMNLSLSASPADWEYGYKGDIDFKI